MHSVHFNARLRKPSAFPWQRRSGKKQERVIASCWAVLFGERNPYVDAPGVVLAVVAVKMVRSVLLGNRERTSPFRRSSFFERCHLSCRQRRPTSAPALARDSRAAFSDSSFLVVLLRSPCFSGCPCSLLVGRVWKRGRGKEEVFEEVVVVVAGASWRSWT